MHVTGRAHSKISVSRSSRQPFNVGASGHRFILSGVVERAYMPLPYTSEITLSSGSRSANEHMPLPYTSEIMFSSGSKGGSCNFT